jgi:hypothetical protein
MYFSMCVLCTLIPLPEANIGACMHANTPRYKSNTRRHTQTYMRRTNLPVCCHKQLSSPLPHFAQHNVGNGAHLRSRQRIVTCLCIYTCTHVQSTPILSEQCRQSFQFRHHHVCVCMCVWSCVCTYMYACLRDCIQREQKTAKAHAYILYSGMYAHLYVLRSCTR